MAVFLHQNHLKRSQSNVRYETLCQLVYGTPAFRVEFLLRILKFRNWTYMSYYYSLYYIPVFALVKSLQIIMRISAQTKKFSYLSRSNLELDKYDIRCPIKYNIRCPTYPAQPHPIVLIYKHVLRDHSQLIELL